MSNDQQFRVRSIVAMPAWLVLAIASSAYASDAVESLPRRTVAEIFQRYDYDASQLNEVECRDDMESVLCPLVDEEHIACEGIDAVEKFCRRILGEDLVQEQISLVGGQGQNALEGCKNYVSWDEDRLNCCPSDRCVELTGEYEWGEWELVPEDEAEDEDYEYQYADVLYEDVDVEPYEDEEVEENVGFYEDDVNSALQSDEDSFDDSNGVQRDGIQHAAENAHRLDDSPKDPSVHILPVST